MPTPLYDSLVRLADSHPLRLDMPGHHGKPLSVEGLWPSAIDFTENGSTGDLFGGGDAIEEAELLWAGRMGFDSCLFLTGGSTQGIHTGLTLLAGAGGHVALDRGSHRSAYHALALLDIAPRYLVRPWLKAEGVTGPVSPDEVEKALIGDPKIKTICITSPTYYGVLSDIPALAEVCHRHGARLMVDGAHGAHLPFLGYEGFSAADLVVMSAHKTLPAPGQAALLLANGLTMDELRRMGSVYGSSSPSYVMMAALDLARDYMDREGAERYAKTAEAVKALRARYPSAAPGAADLDPTRLTLRCQDGFAMSEALRGRGIYPELADSGHVVFILTCADGKGELARLTAALDGLDFGLPGPVPAPPPVPEAAMSVRQALFAPRRRAVLWECEGCVSACQVAPYPPGVPVIAPGERIGKKHLAYLRQIGYNNDMIEVVCSGRSEKEGHL